jgi:hypothetical protein
MGKVSGKPADIDQRELLCTRPKAKCRPDAHGIPRSYIQKISSVLSLKFASKIRCHPERSLACDRGSYGQVFVRGVVERQTESKDLRFGPSTPATNFGLTTLGCIDLRLSQRLLASLSTPSDPQDS